MANIFSILHHFTVDAQKNMAVEMNFRTDNGNNNDDVDYYDHGSVLGGLSVLLVLESFLLTPFKVFYLFSFSFRVHKFCSHRINMLEYERNREREKKRNRERVCLLCGKITDKDFTMKREQLMKM